MKIHARRTDARGRWAQLREQLGMRRKSEDRHDDVDLATNRASLSLRNASRHEASGPKDRRGRSGGGGGAMLREG